jgi:GTP cyclohydrolase III
VKLPGVFEQVALSPQLSALVVHSSISAVLSHRSAYYQEKRLTCTRDTISCAGVSLVTGTGEATRSVHAGSIITTVANISSTLINICSTRSAYYQGTGKRLTCTRDTISCAGISLVTVTGEATRSVRAGSIVTTVVNNSSTLINI